MCKGNKACPKCKEAKCDAIHQAFVEADEEATLTQTTLNELKQLNELARMIKSLGGEGVTERVYDQDKCQQKLNTLLAHRAELLRQHMDNVCDFDKWAAEMVD
jgi:hypothetical protein